jgi:5-formyltetrahydrofolate cyclo-ligase
MSEEAIASEKSALRKRVTESRKLGHDCGHSLCQKLIDFAWEQRAKTIACFISFGAEPNTNLFLKHCQLDEKIKLYVPRVAGDALEWVLFDENQVRHPLGMNEPVGPSVILSELDLLVVPALALDRFGRRLGRGRGFYDRALSKLSPKQVVGVIHSDELVDLVPTDNHDQLVDFICTCEELLPASH